jgi:hypothetical protein
VSTPTIDRPAQILLPFAEKEWISVERAMRILDIGVATLYMLRASKYQHGEPFIDVVDCGHGLRKRVKYASVVRYCDYLREIYGIPDRRPRLVSAILRHRDEDILPFPAHDTINVRTASRCSPYARQTIGRLCEQRTFEAYQIAEDSPWRISRPSFAAWLEKIGVRNAGL